MEEPRPTTEAGDERVHRSSTKIVATIGPATAAEESIDRLLEAGADVVRINCAHGSHESIAQMVAAVRRREAARGEPVAVLADLGGPKLRVGRLQGGAVQLQKGDVFTLTTDPVLGSESGVSVNHPALPREVSAGMSIFLNDGLIRLVVTDVTSKTVVTRVEAGGWLSDLKGLSVPLASIATPSLTEKDRRDLEFVVPLGIDYLGLSFVRSEDDIALLRSVLAERHADVAIVAKIEKLQATTRLEAIVDAADAVMVARGDLGVECPIEEVPILQKRIIGLCRARAKPVITATQMLESMVASPLPTRAEASDVANAVLDGTDAVMLSAETATGKYPIDAVAMMRRIAARAEAFAEPAADPARDRTDILLDDATPLAAAVAARSLRADAIVCLTNGGDTARRLARWRPRAPIFAVTPRVETWRRLALVHGVESHRIDDFGADFDLLVQRVIERLRALGRLSTGQQVVFTAGLPFIQRGQTNTVRIQRV
jgi:pyruvate kinase